MKALTSILLGLSLYAAHAVELPKMSDTEANRIVDAIKRCNGSLAAAARELGSTARIVRYKVKELGIDYKRYHAKKG